MKATPELREKIVDDYFDKKNGLGYTIARTPIGGSDFSSRPYTLDDVKDDFDLEHFNLTKEDFEYKVILRFFF